MGSDYARAAQINKLFMDGSRAVQVPLARGPYSLDATMIGVEYMLYKEPKENLEPIDVYNKLREYERGARQPPRRGPIRPLPHG